MTPLSSLNPEIPSREEVLAIRKHLGMLHPGEMSKPARLPVGRGRPRLNKPTVLIRVLSDTEAKLQIRARARRVPIWRIIEDKDY